MDEVLVVLANLNLLSNKDAAYGLMTAVCFLHILRDRESKPIFDI